MAVKEVYSHRVVNQHFVSAKEKGQDKRKNGNGEVRMDKITEEGILENTRELLGLDPRVCYEALQTCPKESSSPAQAQVQAQALLAKISLGRFRALHL